MSLPDRTTILIVGAGPSGLACAISLINQGCRDIVVVDAVSQGDNTSRALVTHVATLEALDTIECAESMIELGVKTNGMGIRERSSLVFSMDFSTLARYTRFPFSLILPQNITERVLTKKLEDLGVKVLRPYTLTGMTTNAQNGDVVDVSFADGQIIQASYVIGADGARSAVRQLAGIDFVDPDGHTVEQNNLAQMVLADITFSSPIASVGRSMAVISPENFFFMAPLTTSTTDYQGFNNVYRLGCGVSIAFGPPPHAPSTEYLQDLLDKFGPLELSSDPTVNSKPVHISHTLWSTRFRTHSAAADRFFTRFGGDSSKAKCTSDTNRGAVIMLVGDAAHIHSPAGGQGMNLGLRDAIFLGPTIAAHIKQCQSRPSSTTQTSDPDAILLKFASVRRSRALTVIRMTKWLMSRVLGPPGPPSKWLWWFPVRFGTIRNAIIRIAGRFQFVKRMAAWRLSGLAAP
jgi:2-polyprenyl-6-methoxyphenol hydroxylase-like FAD-dependent oxidoreductase